MFDELQGKVVLVTGGGSGIGRASAIILSQAGAKLIIADAVDQGGKDTVAMVREAGGEAIFIKTDVSQPDQVESLVKQILEKFGQLDCAVNCAGVVGKTVPLNEQEVSEFDRVIGINLKGVFLCMKYEIAAMLKQGSGSIVNIASVLGLVASPGTGVYSASKHGVIGLTKSAALDNARTGIRINAICPGTIETPMASRFYEEAGLSLLSSQEFSRIPIGRMGRPEEIAQAVKWLCSPASSYVTGISLPVDGAITAQ